MQQQPGLNLYHAAFELPALNGTSASALLRLRQAQGDRAFLLEREAHLRRSIEMPLAPRLATFFELGERSYLAEEEPSQSATLESLLQSGAPPGE